MHPKIYKLSSILFELFLNEIFTEPLRSYSNRLLSFNSVFSWCLTVWIQINIVDFHFI